MTGVELGGAEEYNCVVRGISDGLDMVTTRRLRL